MNRLAKAVGAALAFALGGAAFARVSLSDISGELEVSGGMQYGTAHEYVIVEEDGSTLSRLDWDEKLVPTVSVAGQARLFDVFASAGVQLAVPFKGGIMEDRDWLDGQGVLTNYSQHSAFLENDFIASFGLGYTFALSDWTRLQIPLRLTPQAGFRYRVRKWTASGGYLDYPPAPRVNVTGAAISYAQTLSSLSAGLEAEYQASRTVALKLRGSVYPYSWAHALDTHFAGGQQFYDRMNGGIGGFAQLSALYRPFELPGSPAFTGSLSYEHIGKLTGKTATGLIGGGDHELGWSKGYGSKTESSGLSASLGIALRLGYAPPSAGQEKLSAPRAPAKAPVPPPVVSGGERQPRPQTPTRTPVPPPVVSGGERQPRPQAPARTPVPPPVTSGGERQPRPQAPTRTPVPPPVVSDGERQPRPQAPTRTPVPPPVVSDGERQPRPQAPTRTPAPPTVRGYRMLTFRVKGTAYPNRTITLNADFVKRDGNDWLLYDTKREDRQFYRLLKHLEWEFGERSVRYENTADSSGGEAFLSGEEKAVITLSDGRERSGVSQTADSDPRLGLCNRVYGEIWELLK